MTDPRPTLHPAWRYIAAAPVSLAMPFAYWLVFGDWRMPWQLVALQWTTLVPQCYALWKFSRFVKADIAWMDRDVKRTSARVREKVAKLKATGVDTSMLEAKLREADEMWSNRK